MKHSTKLAPSLDLLNDYKGGLIKSAEYKERYLKELSSTYPNNKLSLVAESLVSLNEKYGNVVLMCWEGPSKFCHRHTLSKELNKYLSEDNQITELDNNKIKTLRKRRVPTNNVWDGVDFGGEPYKEATLRIAKESTDPEFLRKIVRDECSFIFVRVAAAANPNMSEEGLLDASRLHAPCIKKAVLWNPSTTDEIKEGIFSRGEIQEDLPYL